MTNPRKSIVVAAGLLAIGSAFVFPATAQDKPGSPSASGAPDAAIQRWRDARFGMFIHWGPVSLKGTEIGWSRGNQIPVEEYDSLYKQFNPEKFNANEWVSVAKAAGMKYIVLTTKHHDGFCLWDTKQTDHNIMNSPFKRDVTRELAEACKQQGVAFGTYYSTCDWHHPDFPVTSPGGKTVRATSNLDRYTEYLKAQVKELLTNYGPLWTLWFDVPQRFDQARGQSIIDMARSIQPDIVINNRTGAPGDYDTPEQRIGGFKNTRPWETCMTICHQWAWKPNDTMKSLKECLQTLIYSNGGDGNLLFNVGPEPTGEIEPRQVERLKEMGAWLAKYGQSLYGTRGGPIKPGKWGASTHKGNTVFVHVIKWGADGSVMLPTLGKRIVKSEVLTGGEVTVEQAAAGMRVVVPQKDRQEIDTIVKLELDGPASEIAAVGILEPTLTLGKKAAASVVFGNGKGYSAEKAVDGDDSTRWATPVGTKTAWLEIDLGKPESFGTVKIDEACGRRVQKFEFQYKAGEEWKVVFGGTKIGEGYVKKFAPVTAQRVRLNILDATEGPSISEVQLEKPE